MSGFRIRPVTGVTDEARHAAKRHTREMTRKTGVWLVYSGRSIDQRGHPPVRNLILKAASRSVWRKPQWLSPRPSSSQASPAPPARARPPSAASSTACSRLSRRPSPRARRSRSPASSRSSRSPPPPVHGPQPADGRRDQDRRRQARQGHRGLQAQGCRQVIRLRLARPSSPRAAFRVHRLCCAVGSCGRKARHDAASGRTSSRSGRVRSGERGVRRPKTRLCPENWVRASASIPRQTSSDSGIG
jgi:hypothetical protein